MLPTQSLLFMLLMEEQRVTQVLFSIIWGMILILQRRETWKNFLCFVGLVLECNSLIIWMFKISYVMAKKVLWNTCTFVQQPPLLKMEILYTPNLIMKSLVQKKVKFSSWRVPNLCTSTSEDKEIFIFTTWEKDRKSIQSNIVWT